MPIFSFPLSRLYVVMFIVRLRQEVDLNYFTLMLKTEPADLWALARTTEVAKYGAYF